MQLHRPKDIDSLNEDFFKNEFSGRIIQEDPVITESETEYPETNLIQGEIDGIIVEHESDIRSGYVAKQLERLSNASYENGNRIFHEFPEDSEDEDSLIDSLEEKNLFDSFPEIDFDPSVFNDDDLSEREIRRESVRRAKEDARITIENEKEKIREQKQLEKTVQRPFGKKKTAIVLMVVFIVLNILCLGMCGIFGTMADNGNSLTLSEKLTVHYVDGINISTPAYKGKLIAVTAESIQGSRNVLFTDEEGSSVIGKVIAIGDGIYGIDLGERVVKADAQSIIGVVSFATPDISPVYLFFTAFGMFPVILFALALLFTVLLSVLRIKKLNLEIKRLEENYNII